MPGAHPSAEFAPQPFEEPIRAELFGVERLEQHAESLAAAQPVMSELEKGRRLLPRVEDNGRVLREAYRAIAKAIREDRAITPPVVLVENLRRLAEAIVRGRAACQEADALADDILGLGSQPVKRVAMALQAFEHAPLVTAFAVQLVQRLRDQDPTVTPALL